MTGPTLATSMTKTDDKTENPRTASGSASRGKTGSRATWEKADRLLLEGRLRIRRVDGNEVVAECRGDSGGVYDLVHYDGRWSCSCPARTDCSHLRALWRVVAVER